MFAVKVTKAEVLTSGVDVERSRLGSCSSAVFERKAEGCTFGINLNDVCIRNIVKLTRSEVNGPCDSVRGRWRELNESRGTGLASWKNAGKDRCED